MRMACSPLRRFSILVAALVCAGAVAVIAQAGPAAASSSVGLRDSFDGTAVDSSIWHIPTWTSSTDGTYVGRTQFRVAQNSPLPTVSQGHVDITVQTYNPTGFSFYGTDLISNQLFYVGSGVDIVVRAKMDSPAPRGVVGGIFLYDLKPGSRTLHDEIDFELLGNDPTRVHTNVYADEALGVGHPSAVPYTSGSVTDYHEYRIQWRPTSVSWYVDGNLVRTTTSQVPTGPMHLHLNMWAPDSGWAEAYYAGVQPAASPTANRRFTMGVDSAIVTLTEPSRLISPTPTILGTPKVDQKVTAATGSWGPAPVSLAYQWHKVSSAGTTYTLPGATSAVYRAQASDVGYRLKVKVTGSKQGFAPVSKTSAVTAAVLKASFVTGPIPTVSGTPRVGMTLTAVPGTWSPTPSSFSFQWYRNGAAIAGATAPTYKVTSASLGTVITVKATANRAGYTSASKTSAGTAKVMAGLTTATPTISDTTPRVDQTLTARAGTWGPLPVTFGFQWYRGTTAITGATKATYQVQPADLSYQLKVKATGSKPTYASVARTSALTTAVAKATFTVQPVPTITGTKKVGQTLTTTPGTWSPTPSSLSYQWSRSGTAITGATKPTYLLTSLDKGKTMTVKVTARRAGYTTASKTSLATAVITA